MQKSVGETLAHLRNERHLTLSEVSAHTNISMRTICEFETGKRDIKLSTLRALLRAYGSGIFLSGNSPL